MDYLFPVIAATIWGGNAYAMGVILLGPRAPAAWRDGAKRLLFVTERPYFK